jgi:hypothetical protein
MSRAILERYSLFGLWPSAMHWRHQAARAGASCVLERQGALGTIGTSDLVVFSPEVKKDFAEVWLGCFSWPTLKPVIVPPNPRLATERLKDRKRVKRAQIKEAKFEQARIERAGRLGRPVEHAAANFRMARDTLGAAVTGTSRCTRRRYVHVDCFGLADEWAITRHSLKLWFFVLVSSRGAGLHRGRHSNYTASMSHVLLAL